MKDAFPVIFTSLEDSKDTYLIEVPDLDIVTEGFGKADSIFMARDAIALAGMTLEDSGKNIPKASLITEINLKKGQFIGQGKSYVSLVDVDFDEYRRKNEKKSVRRNVTLPAWLDYEAEKAGINVSRLLQEALKQKLCIA